MKTRTEEQIKATAARREKFRAIVQLVGSMSEDQRAEFAQRAPLVNPDGHALSVHNTVLVGFQRPNCTVVAGFRQWKASGRIVRKGEHGVQIWIPTRPKTDPNRQPGEMSSSDSDEPGFIIGTVFDISQTDAVQS